MRLKHIVLLRENPQTEERVKRAGWKPVRVLLQRMDRADDPQEFLHEPSVESKAVLWLHPEENKVYTRSPVDDEITGELVRDKDGLALETPNGTRFKITKFNPEDRTALTAHLAR